MTTFAYDGRYLAIDSQVTCGNVIITKGKSKLCEIAPGRFAAGAGLGSKIHEVYEWLMGGMDMEKAPTWEGGEVEILVVGLDIEPCEILSGGARMPVESIWVGGSGHQFALAAMHLGRNAMESVDLARKLDCYTGGPIVYFDSQAKDPNNCTGFIE